MRHACSPTQQAVVRSCAGEDQWIQQANGSSSIEIAVIIVGGHSLVSEPHLWHSSPAAVAATSNHIHCTSKIVKCKEACQFKIFQLQHIWVCQRYARQAICLAIFHACHKSIYGCDIYTLIEKVALEHVELRFFRHQVPHFWWMNLVASFFKTHLPSLTFSSVTMDCHATNPPITSLLLFAFLSTYWR